MPKQYIGPADELNDNRVKVGWSREAGHVQIATVNPEGETVSDFDGTDEMRVEAGWAVDLDRSGVNDLIRVLRRARDQAFGRDE